jgi:hypothetical protein
VCIKFSSTFNNWLNANLIKKIITIQTDWGGEYEKLNSFFLKVCITHHVSCPHAHQQNGFAERKHRHIVEVGLALLAHASMPLKFWDEAFLTATFLINLLPSKVINVETPVECLLRTKPNYDSLRIFGCACWPNLRPYNKCKLAYRSTRCVFLGYSPRHKGVKCLDTKTGRVYISRDVVFDENVFPFESLHPNTGSRLCNDILLLPPDLSPTTSNNEGAHVDDHMPIIHIVTNQNQCNAEQHLSTGTTDVKQETAENLSENDEETSSNSSPENSEENKTDVEHEEDSSPPVQDRTDPEADPAGQLRQLGLFPTPVRVYTRRCTRQEDSARELSPSRATPCAPSIDVSPLGTPSTESPLRSPPGDDNNHDGAQADSANHVASLDMPIGPLAPTLSHGSATADTDAAFPGSYGQ